MSSDLLDPGLIHGYAYFVRHADFKNYLKIYDKAFPEEHSTCSNFNAIKLASTHGGQGIAASGIAAAPCSRHKIRRPNSVVDLQFGER